MSDFFRYMVYGGGVAALTVTVVVFAVNGLLKLAFRGHDQEEEDERHGY